MADEKRLDQGGPSSPFNRTVQHDAKRARLIKVNEQSVNAIKAAMRNYLGKLTHHYLSKRQAILIGHIDRCMSDLERVGDHIDNLSNIARRQRSISTARFSPEVIEDWLCRGLSKRIFAQSGSICSASA